MQDYWRLRGQGIQEAKLSIIVIIVGLSMQILRLAEMINTSRKKTLCKELKSIMNERPHRYDCNKKPQQLIKSIFTRNMWLGDQKHHKNDTEKSPFERAALMM